MSAISERPGAERTPWPPLPLDEWQPTLNTLHMWLQIVGKIKLELVPFLNQWWNVTLYPAARGLTTGVIPYGDRIFEIEFDFIGHMLFLRDSSGGIKVVSLKPRTVADFYRDVMSTLASSNIYVEINPIPVEVPHKIPLDSNEVFSEYDPEFVSRWWYIILGTTRVLKRFRSGFTGKSSPVHFFWGGFDLNHTRHSGRLADPPAGAPRFLQLAENEENFSVGFWPGNTAATGVTYGEPAFFAYIYPMPPAYTEAAVNPGPAYYDHTMGLFILRYEDVRLAADPEQAMLDFFDSTYAAAADLAGWDRLRLETRST